MSTQYMSLDWREAPTSLEIKKRIEDLLMELDTKHEALVRLSSSTKSPRAICLVEGAGGTKVIRRTRLQSKKIGQTQLVFWRRMYSMCVTVSEILSHRQPAMARFVEYKEQAPETNMTMAAARSTLLDLALTIDVHPFALGVIPENAGQVAMPKNFHIEGTKVVNVIRYNDLRAEGSSHTEERVSFPSSKTSPIPALIKDLRVVKERHRTGKGKEREKEPERLNAVVVVEHRNLKEVVTGEMLGLGDSVIVIMTCGYPGNATKEFLHMLSKDDACKDIPFLFFADHDVQGLNIFLLLKYGSASSAWANHVLVCSQLRWVGPSKKDLLHSPVAYKDNWKTQHVVSHPEQTEQEVERAYDSWKVKIGRKLQQHLVASTEKDEQLVRSFKRHGILEQEPDVSEALHVMKGSKGKFRLADLAQVDVAYVSMFCRAKIVEWQTTPIALPLVVPPYSATQRRSDNLVNQIDQSQKTITQEQRRALLEHELA